MGLLRVTNVLASLFFWQGIIPGALHLPVASGIGVVFWLPYLADRLLVNRLRGFAATLVFPLLQVCLEYINAIALIPWGAGARWRIPSTAFSRCSSCSRLPGCGASAS